MEDTKGPPMPISQIAIVVKDIHAAMEAYQQAPGWGPCQVYEHKPPALHDTHLHGEAQPYTMIGAETHVGPIVVELLQPVKGPGVDAGTVGRWRNRPLLAGDGLGGPADGSLAPARLSAGRQDANASRVHTAATAARSLVQYVAAFVLSPGSRSHILEDGLSNASSVT